MTFLTYGLHFCGTQAELGDARRMGTTFRVPFLLAGLPPARPIPRPDGAGPRGPGAPQTRARPFPVCFLVLSWDPPPRPTQPRQRSPKCSASRLLIEELNSRVLLGNWLLGAGAEHADVISEPGDAAAQPRAPRPPPASPSPVFLRCRSPNAGRGAVGGEQSAGWGWGFLALPGRRLCKALTWGGMGEPPSGPQGGHGIVPVPPL